MPPRPSHLPHNIERNVLLKLRATPDLTGLHLHPAGPKTVGSMIEKGWIARSPDTSNTPRYRITEAGEVALKAEIPIRKTAAQTRCR